MREGLVWEDFFQSRGSVDLPASEVSEFVSIAAETPWIGDRGISMAGLRRGEMEWARGGNAGDPARLVAADRRTAEECPLDDRVLDTPFWGSLATRLAAAGPGWRACATSLFYELGIVNSGGVPVDSIVEPPPSWTPARPPVQGEFGTQEDDALDRYLSSFSILTSLASVADSVLLVFRGEWSRLPDGNLLRTTRMADVYANGRRLAWDLEAPGELFAYSRSSLFFVAHAGESDTVTEFAWQPR